MATNTYETQSVPSFSRISGARSNSSWARALPAVLIVVAVVVMIGYLASELGSRESQLVRATRDAESARQAAELNHKQLLAAQADLSLARDPGRTTVVMQAPATGKGKAKAGGAWGSAVWGENEAGSWLAVRAYGLSKPSGDQKLDLWFVPASGAPRLAGKLDPDETGTAYLEAKGLPGVDQGKQLRVTLDPADAQAPSDQVQFEATLPALKPLVQQASTTPAPQDQQAQQTEANKAQKADEQAK